MACHSDEIPLDIRSAVYALCVFKLRYNKNCLFITQISRIFAYLSVRSNAKVRGAT